MICLERQSYVFPFTAIVGQTKAKLALILNAINPLIGGVLLRGDKGTGKSTMVRAFAQVLPEIKVVEGCPFNCNPENPAEMCDECYSKFSRGESLPIVYKRMKVVDLPLNASIDRVVGSLDVKRALKEGIKALEPGILAEANRNILYIDEVNLLDDYIADVLLDAAAMGWNIVEREGVSVKHPAKFILVGSMNPEEGELRPQILDRFGLIVNIEAITDPEMRTEIVERVEAFYDDPENFIEKYKDREEKLRERIITAKKILKEVKIDRDLVKFIANICTELRISTHRAEITAVRCSKAIAAFNKRKKVNMSDVKQALELVLPHRLKRHPFEEDRDIREMLRNFDLTFNSFSQNRGRQDFHHNKFRIGDIGQRRNWQSGYNFYNLPRTPLDKGFGSDPYSFHYLPIMNERIFGVRKDVDLNNLFTRNLKERKGSSRASRKIYVKEIGASSGVYISSTIPKDPQHVKDIAIDATIRAAALRVVKELKRIPLSISDEDIREKIRRRPISHLVVFVLDSSGSMAALKRIELAKGIIWNLAKRAYVSKEYVSLIVFRRREATVIVEPTRNYGRVLKELEKIPTGGKTPLSHALFESYRLIRKEKLKRKNMKVSLIIVTDGKANVPIDPTKSIKEEIKKLGESIRKLGVESIVVDTRLPFEIALSLDLMDTLITSLNARHIRVPLLG